MRIRSAIVFPAVLLLLGVGGAARAASGDGFPAPDLRAGVGASLHPVGLILYASSDLHLDKFLALGPDLQLGLGGDTDFVAPALGGRFKIPFDAGLPFEVALRAGIGIVWRYSRGTWFSNFLYQTGVSLDVFVLDRVLLGLCGMANMTGSRVEGVFGTLFATAAYRF